MAFEISTISWDSPRIKILWANDWFDEIMSGVATLDDHRVYFNCISEGNDNCLKFAFYDVPTEVWQEIDGRHRDFQKYVGTHFDYVETDNGRTQTGNIRPSSEHYKFYNKWKSRKIVINEKWKIMVVDSLIED